MTQDWKLTVTIKDYDSYNDEGLMNALEAKLSMKFSAQFFWYNGERPMFNHDGKGVITSTVFDAKIQNDIPEWWEEGFFPKLREFEVVATEENGDDEICWIMKQGKCVSCIQNGEELLDESDAEEEDEDSGDLEVDVWGNFSVQFYARQGAVPDENGKYSDYIGVVDDDWLIEPDCGSTFMGVYASEDCQPSQIYKDRVLPYVENGKAIGINQIDFESGNYSTEDYPEENGPTLRELLDICQLCMDDSEDEECLYRLGMGTEPIPSGSFLDNHGNWASLDSARYNIDGCPNRDFALLPVRAMITDDDEQWDLIAEFDIEKDEVPDLPFITMYDEEFQDYEVDDGEDWLQLGYGSGNLLDADGNTIQSLKDVDHADNEDGETVFWRVPYADLDEEKRKSGEYVLTEEARKKWSEKLGL